MSVDKVYEIFCRGLFILALAMLAVAFVELAANLLGATLLRGLYSPGRLIELSAALVMFVIAILLQQVRDTLRDRER